MSQKILTPKQEIAYRNLNIRPTDRIILAMDGGGIRGMLTIQLLKKIEEIAGIPCYEFCDMVAGTSTGAIIAGLMAAGKTAIEIEELYIQFVTKVFKKRSRFASRFLDIPAYDKADYRTILKEVIGNKTIKEACANSGVDLMITSKNATDNEEVFFTCFDNDGWKGTYQDALLRTVMEATMSAPTYFKSLERFLDGGTTTYNNPSTAALIEAVEHGGKGKYDLNHTTMFSMGTGKVVRSIHPDDLGKVKGPDVLFWLNYVMDTAGQDSSIMQVDLFRSSIFEGLDYRRFQISLDAHIMGRLPNRPITAFHGCKATQLIELTDEDLVGIEMDDVHKFDLVKHIGEAMVDYIMLENKFQRDLNNTPNKRDELVKMFHSSIADIHANVTKAEWIDSQMTH